MVVKTLNGYGSNVIFPTLEDSVSDCTVIHGLVNEPDSVLRTERYIPNVLWVTKDDVESIGKFFSIPAHAWFKIAAVYDEGCPTILEPERECEERRIIVQRLMLTT